MDTQERIRQLIEQNSVMLFMKGSPEFPQCGFSGRAVQILNACGVSKFGSFDVLSDSEVREGIKSYSHWPTIPQLYVKGEFIGGSDIMLELYQKGDLQKKLQGVAG
jgi:monothiol glutaredoxin